jgi:hypothetical protein
MLDLAVEKRGGETVVYECSYARKGRPECLVGEALHIAGVPLAALEVMDNTIGPIVRLRFNRNIELPFTLTDGALDVFRVAQQTQDAHNPWNKAVEKAKAV